MTTDARTALKATLAGLRDREEALKVACLEEVALRMGFVDESQIEHLMGSLPKGEYRSYLELVCAEGAGSFRYGPRS